MSRTPTDFMLRVHGSIALLFPETTAARAWCHEHLPRDALMFAHAFVIEPRYLPDVLAGIAEDKLAVSLAGGER